MAREHFNHNRDNFTPRQRKALRRMYDNTCARCGAEGGDADHVIAAVNGGRATYRNGQWLCPSCNRSLQGREKPRSGGFTITKPELKIKPWRWQAECLEAQLEAIEQGSKTFFTAAGVGSGKTLQTLMLYLQSDYDLLLVVVPKTGIRGSWINDAETLGLTLEPVVDGARFAGPGDRGSEYVMPHGFVLTVDMLPSVINDLALYGRHFRIMACIDEAHHFGEDMTWTTSAVAAIRAAEFVVAMSGTPERTDMSRILCLDYVRQDDMGIAHPSYSYHYEDAVAEQHVAVIHTRFIGGEVDKHYVDGRVETFRYSDGDYSHMDGIDGRSLMQERLRLSATEAFDWQYAAIAEARKTLMACRDDGHPWGGLIACRKIDQAEKIQQHIEKTYGDKCLLIVGDEDTETAVDLFDSDMSYRWVISITKLSEGISIPRLRVGVLLSYWTTRNFFDQLRGRLARLLRGVAPLEQTAYFYVPADPRIIDMATSSNQMMLHRVPWLQEKDSDEDIEETYRETCELDPDADPADMGRGNTTAEQIRELREELQKDKESLTIDIGSYRLFATAQMDGAAVNDEFITEDEYMALRSEMAGIINPHTAVRINGTALNAISQEVL